MVPHGAHRKELAEREPENPFGWVTGPTPCGSNRIKDARSVAEAGLEFVPKDAFYGSIMHATARCSATLKIEYLDKAISLDKRFEAESVSDTDLDNLWKWIHSQDSKAEA